MVRADSGQTEADRMAGEPRDDEDDVVKVIVITIVVVSKEVSPTCVGIVCDAASVRGRAHE